MRILIASFGKLKTPGLREAADYYLKLARSWLPIEEVELKSLPVSDKSPGTRRQIQTREGQVLLEKLGRAISPRSAIYLLDEGGQSKTTQEWAESVRSWERNAINEIVFCIGSSLGFSDAVRAQATGIFSLGPQTLSHELARVVLMEQIYRSWGVVRGHPYHNEGV